MGSGSADDLRIYLTPDVARRRNEIRVERGQEPISYGKWPQELVRLRRVFNPELPPYVPPEACQCPTHSGTRAVEGDAENGHASEPEE